jgi:integrase
MKPILKNVNKNGVGTIYIYVDFYNKNIREQVYFKTSVKVSSKSFSTNGKIRNHPSSSELNLIIDGYMNDIYKAINEIKAKGIELNAFELRRAYSSNKDPEKTITELISDYTSIRLDATSDLIDKLNNLKKRVEDYSPKAKYSGINQEWINRFINHLQDFQQPSTIHRTFKFLKQVLNHYHSEGIIDDRFKKLSYPKPFTQRQMVFTEEEIRMILDHTPSRRYLQRVKDLALIQMFTGLRYSDAVKINLSNIYNNQLNITTQKTNQIISIPLHNALKALLESYQYDLSELRISNQKYNDYLKILIKESGVNSMFEVIRFENGVKKVYQEYKYDLVSSHTFRRTFITNAVLKGISLHVIQSITGHTTLKQLSQYVTLADEIKCREMQKMDDLFRI